MLFKLKVLVRHCYFYMKYFSYIQKDVRKMGKDKRTLVVLSHELSRTGAPMLLLHILKELSNRGWNISLISMSAGPLIKEFSLISNVYISRNPGKLCKLISENGFKNGSVLINSVISGDWCKSFKQNEFNVVSLVHELPGAISCWGAEESARKMVKFSDVVYFPSRFVRNKFQANYGFVDNAKVLPQGVFLKSDNNIAFEKVDSIVRNRYKLDEKPIILNVANGNLRKGFDIFVKISQQCPALNFVWVGDIDRSMNQFLRKYSEKGLIPNLHLLGYINQKNELLELYSSASALALTSREEPFGSIVLEAMSQGTPVVGFKDVGGFQDVVKNGHTGFLTKLEDIDEMAEKLKLLSFDTVLNEQLSENCKTEILNYSFDNYVSNIENELSPVYV